jgi:O-antigen biosynthesis protein
MSGGGAANGAPDVVFLLSSPRAGSTLLSAILNRHSRILCPAEPWFLLSLHALYHGTGSTLAPHDQQLADVGLRELAGEDEFLRAARAFASSLYGSRLTATGRSVFVDKTPRYYHILPFLAGLFPGARMIWLKRNPLDVAASYRTTWGVPVAELVGRNLSPYSFDLTLGLGNLGAWFDGSPGRLEISYEDLVADPEGVVGRTLGFLGLATEPGLPEYGTDTKSLETFRRSFLGDRKVLEHTRPHGRSVGQWRELFSSGELNELLAGLGTDCFQRMGYEEALADALPRAGFRPGDEPRTPRHLDRLRLYRRRFATVLPPGIVSPDWTRRARALTRVMGAGPAGDVPPVS